MKIRFLLFILLGFVGSCNNQSKKQIEETNRHAEWVYDATLYEVNIRQYTPEGTFSAFTSHIPRLKELGVDILWIMPIQPIGEKERKGTLGSYYSIKNYTRTNPEFGTPDDFKRLVDAAHDAGMKVILDWVANHTSHDADWIAEHKDWYVTDSLGQIVSPYDWSDVAKLNYDNADMRKAMSEAMIFWLKETDIDGFRCDVAYEVPTDFWESTVVELKKIKPDIFMLAEAEKPELNVKAFDAYYSWEVHHKMNEIAQGKADVNSLREALNKTANFPGYAVPLLFTSNHDENSWKGSEFERMGDAAGTFAALTFVLPGMPLIYSGQEVGFNRRLQFFEKDSIDWSCSNNFTALYQKLIQLKKANKALFAPEYGGLLEEIATSSPNEIFAFRRKVENNTIIAVFNLSPNTVDFTFNAGDFTFEGNKQMKLLPWEWKYTILSII